MKTTYYGHSALGVECGGKHILVDPFIANNPLAQSIDINQLKADYILITHAHYDHVLDVETIVQRTKATIISNYEIVEYYKNKHGFEGIGLLQGGGIDLEFGRISVVNAVHSSSFPDGTYGGNPIGFILESDNKSVYFAGDTDLSMEMKLIPMFYKLDLAFLPIGGGLTMDVNRAVVAAEFIECDKIVGVHYDTVPFISINHEEAIQKFSNKNKELVLLNVGEQIEL